MPRVTQIKPDNTFRNSSHRKRFTAMFFVVDARGPSARLRGMEAGASAAGDGKEHQRPGGQAGGAMHGPFDVAVEGVPLEGESTQQPNGHEHQQYSEETDRRDR